jgi:hypothetical protein
MKNTLPLSRVTCSLTVSVSALPLSDQSIVPVAVTASLSQTSAAKRNAPVEVVPATTRYHLGKDLPHGCRLAPVEPRDASNGGKACI